MCDTQSHNKYHRIECRFSIGVDAMYICPLCVANILELLALRFFVFSIIHNNVVTLKSLTLLICLVGMSINFNRNFISFFFSLLGLYSRCTYWLDTKMNYVSFYFSVIFWTALNEFHPNVHCMAVWECILWIIENDINLTFARARFFLLFIPTFMPAIERVPNRPNCFEFINSQKMQKKRRKRKTVYKTNDMPIATPTPKYETRKDEFSLWISDFNAIITTVSCV